MDASADNNKLYERFMAAYTQRINDATFKVAINGVRIGNAKKSRLAQINLKSKIITFSKFAIENVPERGRRYLVIHELAHVIEPSHNKKFWSLVKQFEPDYKIIEKELEKAFVKNVKQQILNERKLQTDMSRNLFNSPNMALTMYENKQQVRAIQLKLVFD